MVTILDEVGIVAIGRNEGERLVNRLQSLKSQSSNIIYVDSGSVDDSVSAARNLDIVALILDPTIPFTAARARNEGFAALKRMRPQVRFVQIVDGDCVLAQDWLDSAFTFLSKHQDVACSMRPPTRETSSFYLSLQQIGGRRVGHFNRRSAGVRRRCSNSQ